MKKTILSIIVLMILTLSLTSVFANNEDFILEQRFNIHEWQPNVLYERDDKVVFDGELYQTTRRHTSSLNPIDDRYSYFLLDVASSEKNINYKNGQFKEKTFYNGEVAVKGNKLTGTETVVLDTRLVGLADYEEDTFNVSMFVGTDGVKYSIYSYHNQTNPSNLNTDRLFIRQEGEHLFDVYSEKGFIKYEVDSFSTQIASIPDQLVGYGDTVTLDIEDYFSSYTEDQVFLDLETGWAYVGCTNVIFDTCELEKGTLNEFPPFDIKHYDSLGNDLIYIEGNSATITKDITIAVNDGVDFLSDSFELEIVPTVTPTVVTQSLTGIASTGATFNGEITITGGSTLDYGFEYKEDSGSTWYEIEKGTTTGTLSYTHSVTNLTESTLYNIKAYIDDGTRYYGTTKTFSTVSGSVSTPGLNDSVAYWSMDNLSDSAGTRTLTNYGSASVTGLIENAYEFDTDGEYLDIPNNLDSTLTGDFSTSLWIKPYSYSDIYGESWVYSFRGNRNIQLKTLTNGSVRFNIYIAGTPGTDYFIDSPNALTLNDWNHIVATKSSSNGMRLYVDGTLVKSAVGATGTPDSNSAGSTIGTYKSAPNDYRFNGSVDEFALYGKELNSTQVSTLYNSGDGLNPYADVPTPPVQTGLINDIDLEVPESITLDLDDYFTGFTSYTVTYDDPDSASQIVLTGTQSDTSSAFTGATNGLTNELTITSIDNITDLEIEIVVTNSDGQVNATPLLTITNPEYPPVQTASLLGFLVEETKTQSRDIDDYFVNYTSFVVSFQNPDNTSETINLVGTDSHSNSYFNISTIGLDNTITVEGINTLSAINYSIQVSNLDGIAQDTSTIEIFPEGLAPPTQTASIAPISIDINEDYDLKIGSYFANYVTFSVSYINPDTSTLVNYTSTQSESNSKFNIALAPLFAGDKATFTGVSELSPLTLTVQVCNNSTNCIEGTTTLSITDVIITPPNDFEEMLDDLFGSNGGSRTVKLIIGLMIILGLILFAWVYTKAIVISLTAGLIGLIISLALGFISIWLVLLIILISLIPLFYKLIFGRGG